MSQKQKEAIARTGVLNRGAPGEVTYNSCESKYRGRALSKGREYLLTREQFRTLVTSNCSWCNEKPPLKNKYFKLSGEKMPSYSNTNDDWAAKQWVPLNGIDRRDNTKGYTLENSVSCCESCNEMKSCYPENYFMDHINKIYTFQKGLKNVKP